MTDDLLTTFRSEMPMPDDETTQRTYERATSGRRQIVTRRRLVAVLAVLAAAGIAGGLSLTLGGGGGNGSNRHGGFPVRPGGFMPLVPLSLMFNHHDQTLTSIDARVNNTRIPNATMTLEVLHSDASQVSDVTAANTQSVFDLTAPMTSTGSTSQDATVSFWSGTLSPSDWKGGGCGSGIYRVRTAVYPAGTSVSDPFTSSDSDRFASEWFTCNGSSPGVTGTNGPTGTNGTTGASGPIAY